MRLAMLLVLSCGCAATPARSAPVLNTGSEDLDGTRAAVVYLSSDCSGVLIAPSVVLTAAHCVIGEDETPTVHVFRGRERWEARASSCRTHPQAIRAGTERCDEPNVATSQAHDLAVLGLASAVPRYFAEPIPVMIAPPVEGTHEWWRGRRVRLVGWHRRPALVGEARRYSGDNVIASVRGPVLTTVPIDRDGFSTRIGASGGPVLIDIGGREHVAGILFGGERADSRDSVYSATFHADNASWIVRVASDAFAPDLADPTRARFSRQRLGAPRGDANRSSSQLARDLHTR